MADYIQKTSKKALKIVQVAPGFYPGRIGVGRLVNNICADHIKRAEIEKVTVYQPKTVNMDADLRVTSHCEVKVPLTTGEATVKISQIKMPDADADKLSVFLVENSDDLFGNYDLENRGGIITPWIVFSKAVLQHLLSGNNVIDADIIHCYDWQTGLLPMYLKMMEPKNISTGIVFTPYNYKALGTFSQDQWHLTGLPDQLFTFHALEYMNKICLFKAGFCGEMVLFPDDKRMIKAISGSDPDAHAGIGDFIKVHRDEGKVFGMLPSEPGIYDEKYPFPPGLGAAVLDAYRLSLLGDKHVLNFYDVLKERKFEQIYKHGNKGGFNPARNTISLNLEKDFHVIQTDVLLSSIEKAARLEEIKKDPQTGRYPIMRYESPLHYLPEKEEQAFKILTAEERKEILDLATDPVRRNEIMTRSSRQLLALYLLEKALNIIHSPMKEHYLMEIIDKRLGKSILDDEQLQKMIDVAMKLRKISVEEANILRVLIHYIKNGETRKIWQANEILKKMSRKLVFNRGTVALISNKGENRNRGRLIILSGMSGVGKGTVYRTARDMGMQTVKVVLYNTREPRPGEGDRDYNFIKAAQETIDEIRKMSEDERFNLLAEALKKVGVDPSDKDDRTARKVNKINAEYVPTNEDPEDIFESKLHKLAKVKAFLQLLGDGEFCAVSLVGKDFQAVGNDLFKQVNSEQKVFLLEADVNLADQIVNQSDYGTIDSMSIMIVPPTGKELLSRLLNRNTETAQEILERYEYATEMLQKSKDRKVHDFYLENDDELRTVYELMGLTGTSDNVNPRIWKNYNGYAVARAYHDLIQQMRDSQKIFNADFKNVNLTLSENAVNEIAQNILQKLQMPGKPYADAPIIVDAVREYAEKHSDERKYFKYFMGIRPGSDNPVHFGHITSGLAPIIALKLNGVVFATGGRVPEKKEIAAFKHRYAMTGTAIKYFKDWLGQTDIRGRTAKLADIINPATGKSIMGETSEQQRSLSDIVAFAWLRIMNPDIKWAYITGSDKINKYASENERELVEGILKELNFIVVYLERDKEPVDLNTLRSYGWLKQLFNEGFFQKCPIPMYSGLSSSDIRRKIVEKDATIKTNMNLDVLNDIRLSHLTEVYTFEADTEKKLERDKDYRSSDEYKAKFESLRKKGLID